MDTKDFIIVKCGRCGRLKAYHCPRKFGQLKDYKIANNFLTINPVTVPCFHCPGSMMMQVPEDQFTAEAWAEILSIMVSMDKPSTATLGTFINSFMEAAGADDAVRLNTLRLMAEDYDKTHDLRGADIHGI